MNRGRLIAFEGIDGTGKSTQLSLLAAYLRGRGYRVLETREPTDGEYGQKIRQLYDNRSTVSLDDELELFVLDRRQHVRQVINPALGRGEIVLTDRYYFSTAAYQGAAGADPEAIFAAHQFAPEPDLVLLLELDPEEGLRRISELRGEQPNDFENREQLIQVARLFTSFTHPCITRIDATGSIEQVQDRIRAAVSPLLPA